MKKLLITTTMFISSVSMANTVFIGDSIAHGYKLYNNSPGITRIGASPKEVLSYVNMTNYNNLDKVVLSSGLSNNCKDTKSINSQLAFLNTKSVKVTMLGNNNCTNGNITLKSICAKYKNCKFETIPKGNDRVHPNNYRHKF